MIGDVFKPDEKPNPCLPSPCGPNSRCQAIGDSPSCSCLEEFIGTPPNCRPQCISNSECPSHLACINQKCRDPCPGSCGSNAECKVINHIPMCICNQGYEGDPFVSCKQKLQPPTEVILPCNPSPCGPNAICKDHNGAGSCQCLPDYFGNPYEGCRPECILNSDCPSNKACMQNKCRDPCSGTCGQNTICQVINHVPSCVCIQDYTGDPYRYCTILHDCKIISVYFLTFSFSNITILFSLDVDPSPPKKTDACQPSPCGPNSQCKTIDGTALCSCLSNYVGTPPACRPECVVSSECSSNKACINQKCVDPCPGSCGVNTECRVINHSPLCSCKSGFIGEPFTRCYPEPSNISI